MLFNVANDSPTLTGAKVTFTIDLEFPHTQKVLPSGDVVWAEDCTVNGETRMHTLQYCPLFSLGTLSTIKPLFQGSDYKTPILA